MCYYIGIESLVANALIELFQKGCRKVSFETIERYGTAVVKHLNDNGEEAVLVLSRERTRGFIINYSKYFVVDSPDLPSGTITLRDEYTADDLAKAFCGGIALPVLEALLAENTLSTLQAA